MKRRVLKKLLPFLLTAVLTACGGGGGDGGEDGEAPPPPLPPPSNRAPSVNTTAIPNPANGGDIVRLNGVAVDSDGTVASFVWEQTGGMPTVVLSNTDSANPTFTAPTGPATELTFRLTVTDDDGATASDDVTVNVTAANQPPTVDVTGSPNPADGGDTVRLRGVAVDADGMIASFAWVQIGTPAVALSGADTAAATFTAPTGAAAELTFRLTVTDDDGAEASADVGITVTAANQPPTVNVTAIPNPAEGGDIVTLTGAATDADGMVDSYVWDQIGMPAVALSGADTATATFTAPMGPATDLTLRLTVTDDDGAMATDEVTVMVNRSNLPPELTAEANPNPANGGDEVTLTGMANDPDGTVASFAWVQTGGTPMVDLSGADTATATFTAPTGPPTDLTFRLTVTDDEGAEVSAEVAVAVNRTNRPPEVNVHILVNGVPADHADAGDAVTLVGAASDSEGTVDSTLWEQTSGIPMVMLSDSATLTATFTAPVTTATELTFRLTVTDDEGAEASAEVSLRVAWYLEVSAGGSHACGVREGGAVSCWGANGDGQSMPPAGAFELVSAGGSHTCGVKADGIVECWGANGDGQATPPVGVMFDSVSAGGLHTCGVRADDDTVECWGYVGPDTAHSRIGAPAGNFLEVSAGEMHSCGVKTDGTVECWGDDILAVQNTPTGGLYTAVSAGGSHSCGVLDTGAVECWGEDALGQGTDQAGPFSSVSAGEFHTCGVEPDGDVRCWGGNGDGQSTPPTGPFDSVSGGSSHTCGVKPDGAVECWGSDLHGQSRIPAGAFALVDAATEHTCGVLDTGDGFCWGEDLDQSTMPPLGPFGFVSAGHHHSCWLDDGGTGVCRGDNGMGQSTAPMGALASVSAGQFHTCWVVDTIGGTGAVACHGRDTDGQSTPPAGMFASVSAGDLHNCGVKADDGSVECWGYNGDGQSTPPAGVMFDSVSAGGSHTCGVRADDGTVECWGANGAMQSDAPMGTAFESVSAGGSHTCGVTTSGTLECWGDDASGQSMPPAGMFDSVNAGSDYTCGVRDDGAVECWGDYAYSP